MSALAALHPDPGPLTRLKEITAAPNTMEMIAQRVAEGEKLRELAKSLAVPYGPFAMWIYADPRRNELYWNAVKMAAHAEAEEAVDIADDAEPALVPKAALQIKARQWRAERLFKDQYAARVEQTGSGGGPVEVTDPQEIARRLLFAIATADHTAERVVAEVPAQNTPVIAPEQPKELI